jgi:hypothetical protein
MQRSLSKLAGRPPLAFHLSPGVDVSARARNGRRLLRHEGRSAPSFRLRPFAEDPAGKANRGFLGRIRSGSVVRGELYPAFSKDRLLRRADNSDKQFPLLLLQGRDDIRYGHPCSFRSGLSTCRCLFARQPGHDGGLQSIGAAGRAAFAAVACKDNRTSRHRRSPRAALSTAASTDEKKARPRLEQKGKAVVSR